MLLYFTGTGNSKYLAEFIAKELGSSVYSINDGVKNATYPEISDDVLVFSLPTYAWRIPRAVRDWIEQGVCFGGQKAYFVLNCGSDIGNAEKYLRQLCAKKHLTFMGCAEVRMPENYIARYDCPSEEKSLRIVERAEEAVLKIVPLIQSGSALPTKSVSMTDRVKSGLVNDCFYPFCVGSKKFYAKEGCIGCGRCETICPMNTIRMENNRPVWGLGCTHCMACICHCPKEAIEYGTISEGKRRYRCPK